MAPRIFLHAIQIIRERGFHILQTKELYNSQKFITEFARLRDAAPDNGDIYLAFQFHCLEQRIYVDYSSYESTCDAPVLDEARPFQFGVNHHEGEREKEREGVRGQFRVIVN